MVLLSTNLSICVSMRLNAHNLRFLNEKGRHSRIVPRVIYSVTVEASLLYGIKAISFTTLTESPQVEPSQHTHTPLHLWKPSQSTAGTRTTRRNRSSKTTRSTRKGSEITLSRRIFVSLWWKCKKLMVGEVLTLEVWFRRLAFYMKFFFFFLNIIYLWKINFLFYFKFNNKLLLKKLISMFFKEN